MSDVTFKINLKSLDQRLGAVVKAVEHLSGGPFGEDLLEVIADVRADLGVVDNLLSYWQDKDIMSVKAVAELSIEHVEASGGAEVAELDVGFDEEEGKLKQLRASWLNDWGYAISLAATWGIRLLWSEDGSVSVNPPERLVGVISEIKCKSTDLLKTVRIMADSIIDQGYI